MNHEWPTQEEHVWSKWMNADRKTKYRVCVHPKCNAVEYREASKS
jgi:hypothetical protein